MHTDNRRVSVGKLHVYACLVMCTHMLVNQCNKHRIYYRIHCQEDVNRALEKYCTSERRVIKVIDPFKFELQGREEGLYIAVIEEVKHGVFMLKAVYRQPTDQTNSVKYDIVLPGR